MAHATGIHRQYLALDGRNVALVLLDNLRFKRTLAIPRDADRNLGLKNGAKNLLQDVLYVFRALDVVVVEDLLSNLLAWGSWWSFTLCHSVTVLIFVYPSMGHKVDSCNTDLHKLFYTPEL